MNNTFALSCLLAALGGCSSMPPMASDTGSSMSSQTRAGSQDSLPAAVRVPSGNRVAMETVGVGEIAYQCREKQGAGGTYEWIFAGPKATLSARDGTTVGSYYGPPATWESKDGSKLTGTQVAVAPAGSGNIPYQLVKANPAMGNGAMTGVTYIQRVATRGGVAPMLTCSAANAGFNEIVRYQADYIFWSDASARQSSRTSLRPQSPERMSPPALATTILAPSAPMAVAPVPIDEDDRRAQEAMARTDMMRPQVLSTAERMGPASRMPTVVQDEDDRRMAEIIRRTDQMRPD